LFATFAPAPTLKQVLGGASAGGRYRAGSIRREHYETLRRRTAKNITAHARSFAAGCNYRSLKCTPLAQRIALPERLIRT
jgi:hypothetical protein